MMWHKDIERREAWAFVAAQAPDSETLRRAQTHVEGTDRFVGVFWREGLVAVYGAARPSICALEGYIWLQAGPEVAKHRTAFARNSLDIVEMFFWDYTDLVGVTDSEASKRWLSWLGAKFGPRTAEGLMPFIFRRPHG